MNTDTPLPPDEPAAQNPPDGAIIDYWLKADAGGPVTLEILDAAGQLVRRFSSDDAPEPADAGPQHPELLDPAAAAPRRHGRHAPLRLGPPLPAARRVERFVPDRGGVRATRRASRAGPGCCRARTR